MTHRERFAPSPTGPLHLGHAFSALTAYDRARTADGECLIRIEDIDQTRARPEWEAAIFDDLHWLGLRWPEPVLRQSERMPAYQAALETLRDHGHLFACSCTRKDIAEALRAPQEGAPVRGPDGLIYPGTCRDKRLQPGKPLPRDVAIRLDMRHATRGLQSLTFHETGNGPDRATGPIEIPLATLPDSIGDIVLARRDIGTSYHLAVVVDDAHQEITHVTRGEDLMDATAIHVLLQNLLGLPTPIYHHHRLIRDDTGKRLAKRDDALAISQHRRDGKSAADIRRELGLG